MLNKYLIKIFIYQFLNKLSLMILYNMDAYLVSSYIKKSLQKKKNVEHADFLTPTMFDSPSISNVPSVAPVKVPVANAFVDNSINDYNTTNIIIEEDEDEDEEDVNKSASKISTGTFILLLLINSYAAYLSWECNTSKNYPLMLKVVFSLFAFMFGSLYILYYMLFKFDDCNSFREDIIIV